MRRRTSLTALAALLTLTLATALPAAADQPETHTFPALVVIPANPCLPGSGAITLEGELTITIQQTPHGRRVTEILHLEGSSTSGQRYQLHFHGHVPQGAAFTYTVQGRGQTPSFLATITFHQGSGVGDVGALVCSTIT